MATHDYVIDNSTGANVRADINNVLQAILTNNSSSSAPSTTAAYMWWADTTNGVLKIRNSSNNAWVELLQLDGTITLEDGSASTPALAFRDDLNTGVFSNGADEFNIATGGTSRISITTTGMSINDNSDDFDIRIEGNGDDNLVRIDAGNDRVGIGTSAPQNDFHLISGNTDLCKFESNNTGSTGAVLILFHSTSSPADSDIVGTLSFRGKDSGGNETTFADIRGSALDVTDGTEDGELIFNTTAAGGFGEKMRLNPGGRLLLGTSTTVNVGAPVGALYQIETTSQNAISCVAHRGTSNTSGSILILAKSRGTTAGSANLVANGDELGAIRFAGADGTDLESRGGEINCVVDGSTGSNDMPAKLQFKTTADGASTATTRMIIDKDGQILLGASGLGARINPTDTGVLHIEADQGNNFGSSRIQMKVDNSEIMRLTAGTNPFVAIGRTTQQGNEGFTVQRNGQDVVFFTQNSSGNYKTLRLLNKRATSSTTGRQIEFLDESGNTRGSIENNTSTTTYNTSSDYRLKENEVEISDGIDRIKQLKPYRFNWKNRPNLTVDGFFAHEVENIVEDCVSGEKDGEEYQQMDHSKLVPLLVAAVKQLITKVETLEAA